MDPEVAQTLAALERKLADLERELTTIGRPDAQATSGLGSAPSGLASAPPDPSSQSGASASPPAEARLSGLAPAPHPGVLIDEAVGQRFSMEPQETVFGEIPATKDERQSIDVGDLVRFKERMQSTLQGLIDEYTQLLSLKPPTDA